MPPKVAPRQKRGNKMKKIVFTLALLCVLTAGAFGQTMLDLNTYYQLFSIRRSADIVESDYVWAATDNEILSYGVLNWNGREDDDTGLVDTLIEFALLSYYSSAVRSIRPVQANEILPANNPRLAGLKLGAALYQEIQILRFLANNQAVERRYEGMLRFVCDNNGVTRAEIEAFYRNNIRALVSQVVDEAVRDAQASASVTLPNNTIPAIKQLFTNFYLSPNQADYDAIVNYTASRRASDEREIQRIRQMNIPNDPGGFLRLAMETEVRMVTVTIEIILLQSQINLGFRTR